jgi:exonuclease SbcC
VLELVRVDVQNYRSFVHASFGPLGVGQGITAINGPNGSGKSSLATHAVVWALYGVTPDGVPVKAMRRQGSSDEVSVAVTFRHENQEVVVARSLRGKNDTTVARILVDGVEQTNISARTAAAWVTRRLGVDAEGFLTAFVVRQKELDALVKARPAERRALIERLAGIDQMSTALAKAREQARKSQARLEATGDVPDINGLEEALAAAESEVTGAQAKELAAQTTLEAATQAYEAAAEQLRVAEEIDRMLERNERDLSHFADKLAALHREADELQRECSQADLLPDAQAEHARLAEELRELESEVAAAAAAIDECTRANNAEEILGESLKQVRDEYAAAQAQATRIQLELGELSKTVGIEDLEERLQSCNEEIGAAAAETKRIESAIALLSETSSAGEASCPTCKSAIGDPAELIEEMERERAAAQAKQAAAARTKREIAALLGEERERESLRIKAETRLASLNAAMPALFQRLTQMEERHLAAQNRAEDAAEAAHEAITKKGAAEGQMPALMESITHANTAIRKAENAITAQRKLGEVNLAIAEVDVEMRQKVQERELTISTHGSPDMPRLRSEVEDLRQSAMSASNAHSETKMATVLSGRNLENAQQALQAAAVAKTVRDAAQSALERDQALAEALDDFRKDRVARLAPELSEVASDLLQRMMEGKYSSVDLDEDFTPILTEAATGLERPAAWLSGGEESSVALALRIAVGEVVSGQSGGLLVLDEVLTAQDHLRRAATMGAIRNLARQVIVINHVSEATDMVDLVVQVNPSVEDGSTIEHLAGQMDAADLQGIDE